MYVMLCTRPDIYFVVDFISHYQSNPRPTYWQAVKVIIRYLHGSTNLILCYQGEDLKLRGYSDDDGVMSWISLGLPQDVSSPLMKKSYHGAVRNKTA